MIESLSLIDAVMPDVVEQRKQTATKNQQLTNNKGESNTASTTNGEESTPALSKSCSIFIPRQRKLKGDNIGIKGRTSPKNPPQLIGLANVHST